MKYLVDVNVLSEPTKPQPSPRVLAWIARNEAHSVVDAVVLAEISRGIDGMPSGRRKRDLESWFQELRSTTICLDWTEETGIVWGKLFNKVKRAAFTVGMADTMIAATAKLHGLTVATRNVDDFTRCGVPVVNPFE